MIDVPHLHSRDDVVRDGERKEAVTAECGPDVYACPRAISREGQADPAKQRREVAFLDFDVGSVACGGDVVATVQEARITEVGARAVVREVVLSS